MNDIIYLVSLVTNLDEVELEHLSDMLLRLDIEFPKS